MARMSKHSPSPTLSDVLSSRRFARSGLSLGVILRSRDCPWESLPGFGRARAENSARGAGLPETVTGRIPPSSPRQVTSPPLEPPNPTGLYRSALATVRACPCGRATRQAAGLTPRAPHHPPPLPAAPP